MPSKYPCCSECGTKLNHVISTVKSPNEYRVRFYYCGKCEVDIVMMHRTIQVKGERTYNKKIIQFVFSHIPKSTMKRK